MDVIGHNDEFVKKEFALIAIVRQGVDQKFGICLTAEDRDPLRSYGRDEKHAFGVHLAIFASFEELCQ